MSDEGEKTCPLCAEEMDFTDQQLKPCKCGYEICVWCWHHIMNMAEKDETEGRCPACRTPYDKERIVGTALKCERLVAEISMEKKIKSQKAKSKASDGRRQLNSVRVIQRNLVYIVGLPLDLADEDLLVHKEYFGQYGKVLKVSISRTSAGAIQQFPNDSCSVYITYSSEDEAVRCIQSVHGFILEGRSLRACFGTTKYCHSWLRNVPCTNPECLYLHEVGPTEDSFTKDEIISAYSRVQQITGISNNVQRRSGTVLPSPADEYTYNGSNVIEKPAAKSATNQNLGINAKVPSPASGAGRPGNLPAAASWARTSNCQSSAGSVVQSNVPTKQQLDMSSGLPLTSSALTAVIAAGTQNTDVCKHVKLSEDTISREPKGRLELLEHGKRPNTINYRSSVVENSSTSGEYSRMVSIGRIPSPSGTLDSSKLVDRVKEQTSTVCLKDRAVAAGSNIDKIRSDEHSDCQDSEVRRSNGLCLKATHCHRNQGINHHIDPQKMQEQSAPSVSSKDETTNATDVYDGASSWKSDLYASDMQKLSYEMGNDITGQWPSDAAVSYINISTPFPHLDNLEGPPGSNDVEALVNLGVNLSSKYKQVDEFVSASASSLPIGSLNNFANHYPGSSSSCVVPNDGIEDHLGRSANVELKSGTDAIENRIISNILSLDLDAWDESLTSPQSLVKLLGEPVRQQGPVSMPNSWRPQNSSQSRFSFARQEARSQVLDPEPSVSREMVNTHSFAPVFVENRDQGLERHANGYGVPYRNFAPVSSTNKFDVPRAQISAPPGFSAPNRPPPPGFSVHNKNEQGFDINSGNHFLDTSSLHNNLYQAAPITNPSVVADIEFIDPAILAVGKGVLPSGLGRSSSLDVKPNFSAHTSAYENDSRLQVLMQRTVLEHENQRFGDIRDHYPLNDAHGFASRHIEPSQPSNIYSYSQFPFQQQRSGVISNPHYDAWPDVHSGRNTTGIAELLGSSRLGFNKLYGAHEDFQASRSGDFYSSRQYGM